MAKFTVDQPINIRWNGLDISGSGLTYRIPDAYYEEFVAEVEPRIRGTVTWLEDDEIGAIDTVTLPIAQSDVSGLVSALAVLTAADTTKYDKAGGIISGSTTVTGTLAVNGAATLSS